MSAPTLRVAVATGATVVRWQARCVEALAAVPGVAIEQWIRASAAAGAATPVTAAGTGAQAPIEPPEALERTRHDGAAPSGPDRVDVLLDLTSDGLASPLDHAPEVWHFGYGDALGRDPGRAATIDFVRHPGRTRVALLAEPGGRIVREGLLSWWRGEHLDRILLDPATWPATVALDRTDPPPEPPADAPGSGAAARERPSRQPRSGVLEASPRSVLRLASVGRRLQRAAASVVRHDGWNVGIADAPIERMLGPDAAYPVTWLPARPGLFAADPFGLERDGVVHVFYEEYDQEAARGTISHVPIAADGTIGPSEPVLDPGVHTSYPFLVEDGGATFMLPETCAARELVLYVAVDFPLAWRREAVLLPGIAAVDASVVRYADRWWMFATRLDHGANHNLFVWHAPELTGPWTAHAANPVKTDAGSARPGGTPYVRDGILYRPSQDDSLVYGGGIVVNRIDVLTPRLFAERPVGVVRPRPGSPYPDGLHTLSEVGRRTLIDGNRLGFVRQVFLNDVAHKLGRPRGRSR